MRRNANLWLILIVFVATVAAAELIIQAARVPPFIFPAPSRIAGALWVGLSNGVYLKHLGVTLSETALGFLLGIAFGFGLGTLVALNRYVEMVFYPYIVAFQSLPKVALAPLMVIWFGVGMASKVVNAGLIAFFPLLVNVIVGLRSADEDHVNMMRSLGSSERQIFWKLRLPGALPFIMAGIDVAIVFSLIGAIVGEFVGANEGLGYLITTYNFQLDISGSFSILIILSVVGLILHNLVVFVKRRVLFWDPSEKYAREDTVVA